MKCVNSKIEPRAKSKLLLYKTEMSEKFSDIGIFAKTKQVFEKFRKIPLLLDKLD